jgi:phosphatidylserine/phosphatidylglycerophosphate/cardiolipin synthase-like enzyme
MYGRPGKLKTKPTDEISFEISTEKEWGPSETHGVWFNRGAIAGQKFAEEFDNRPPQNINNPKDPEVKWLSRGLLEACLAFINETQPGDALRVAAYEFTYPPILNALKNLLDREIDVKIVYHDTTDPNTGVDGENEKAMRASNLPINDQAITYRRSKTKIPHNKFIVRLRGGTDPVEVWTGSTNFTASGFLGQSNVGHRIAEAATANQYFDLWKVVKDDPELGDARSEVAKLTPEPPEVIAPQSITCLFSPRESSKMLGWYGRRMLNAANSLWFTAAFGVAKVLIEPIARKRKQMRFVLLEKPVPPTQQKELTADFNRVILSYGVPLGELYQIKEGKVTSRRRIKEFELDKWFFKEEHFRSKNNGFVFFVHTKFLLIDPLSEDPLVCSGSANFSSGSLLQNDENMAIIRGNTRVTDIYMTEFDRIFRHFYFRDIANQLAGSDSADDAKSAFLDETSAWTKSYFKTGTLKSNRRLMFFNQPTTPWAENAMADPSASAALKRGPRGTKSLKTAEKKTTVKKLAKNRTVKKKPKKPTVK